MGESRDKRLRMVATTPELHDYVVYITSVVSIKVRTNNEKLAAEHGAKEVKHRLERSDSNVYIPKVAVMTAEDDDEQKRNLANKVAPWLTEGEPGADDGQPDHLDPDDKFDGTVNDNELN